MNPSLQYELRGWAYWAKCLNPLRPTITIRDLPLEIKLLAYKRDAVGRGLYRRKIHEPALTDFLLTRFANAADRNFIDVGANIGYFSCLMSKLAGPAGTVLAVEPEPDNLKLLEQNLKINNLMNVSVYACALGDHEGLAKLGLYKAANRGRHSILDTDANSTVPVRVRTLDELVKSSAGGVASWSLVKIDVEGYEGFVLAGAKETLLKMESLVMEFSPALLKKAGFDPASLLDTLCREFSKIYRIEGIELVRTAAGECLASDAQSEMVFER
jgi:FkbM family methyltransferase